MSKRLFLGLLFAFMMIASNSWSQEALFTTYYANRFHGRKTTSGEVYLKNGFTCANNRFPLGTYLLVRNPDNGKQVIVKVNDRMSSKVKSKLDLSYAAAKQVGLIQIGIKKMVVIVLEKGLIQANREELLAENNTGNNTNL